ncbi:MAG: glycosyltransferase [Paraprevotella sp.]|nr:glycosyltransferase [Paraprevotella sp.]
MLSILIPTYNQVCVRLVTDLQRQAERLECPYEIWVADDASDEVCKRENRKINQIPHCKYIELKQNLGRARIRNFLGRQAQYEYLLFMDSDAAVVNGHYLLHYMEVRRMAPVVYGGLVHPDRLPSPEVSLAYRYEKHAEPRFTMEKRNRHPYKVFRTFNFMIRREVFLQYPFDETITRYGHEDTLFGKALKDAGIKILHIDNPLMNCGLDTNCEMLRKTEESLQTLYLHRKKLEGSSGLLSLFALLQRLKLVGIVRYLFGLTRSQIRRHLLSPHPNLYLFAFYKAGYYSTLFKQ